MSIPSQATDIAFALQDSGVSVSSGSTTTYGFVDAPEEFLLEQSGIGGQISKMLMLTLQTGSIANLIIGTSLTVYGGSYKVAQRQTVEDGALTRVLIKEA